MILPQIFSKTWDVEEYTQNRYPCCRSIRSIAVTRTGTVPYSYGPTLPLFIVILIVLQVPIHFDDLTKSDKFASYMSQLVFYNIYR